VVVVVDGPISGELEKEIQSFKNGASFLVKAIYIQSPKGLWNARNVGIGEAEHEIVALHDADDVMHPERLQFQTKAIVENGLDVLGSPVYEFDSVQERILGVRSLARNDQLTRKMIWQNVVNHSSVTLRKSVVTGVGGYRNIHLAEDYDLWLRLIFTGKSVGCTEEILQAFSVDSNLSKRRGGAKFISSEFALHRLIRSKSSVNVFALWVRLISRLAFRLSPRIIRKAHRVCFQVIKSPEYEPNLFEFANNPPRRIIRVS
jgi:glycosyltransferase involved in cell wall biosynthesis